MLYVTNVLIGTTLSQLFLKKIQKDDEKYKDIKKGCFFVVIKSIDFK